MYYYLGILIPVQLYSCTRQSYVCHFARGGGLDDADSRSSGADGPVVASTSRAGSDIAADGCDWYSRAGTCADAAPASGRSSERTGSLAGSIGHGSSCGLAHSAMAEMGSAATWPRH